MKRLYLLYDENCELCKRLKDWLLGKACWIDLRVLPAGSDSSRTMFPGLERIANASDLVVVSEAGEVYLNNHAWIMCLYALEEYRDWAVRLASPLLQPLARQAWEMLSKNRAAISTWMLSGDQAMADKLRSLRVGECGSGTCESSAGPAEVTRSCTNTAEGHESSETVRDYLQ